MTPVVNGAATPGPGVFLLTSERATPEIFSLDERVLV